MGTIEYDSSQNRYRIHLQVRSFYNVQGTELDFWKQSFLTGSEYLFNATRGQMEIATIAFLNNQNSSTHTDVYLTQSTDNSSTGGIDFHRTPDDRKITGNTELTHIAKTQPLEAAHEIGHLVVELADEYTTSGSYVNRKCTKRPSSSACIMEYAEGYSKVLSLGSGGTINVSNPVNPEVTNFCFPTTVDNETHEHMFCDGGAGCTASNNWQEYHYHQSCWETLVTHYPQLTQPGFDDPVSGTINIPVWIIRTSIHNYTMTVFGSQSLIQNDHFTAAKNAAVAWTNNQLGTDHRFGISSDTVPLSFVQELQVIDETNVDGLIEAIENMETGNIDKEINYLDFEPFDPNAPGAFQTHVLVIPADHVIDDQEFVENLVREFERRWVNIVVVTIGLGELPPRFQELEVFSAHVRHIPVIPDPDGVIPPNSNPGGDLGSLFRSVTRIWINCD